MLYVDRVPRGLLSHSGGPIIIYGAQALRLGDLINNFDTTVCERFPVTRSSINRVSWQTNCHDEVQISEALVREVSAGLTRAKFDLFTTLCADTGSPWFTVRKEQCRRVV